MGTLRFDRRRRVVSRETVIDNLTLGDALQRLTLLAPSDVQAVEIIVKDALRRHWPSDQQPIDKGA